MKPILRRRPSSSEIEKICLAAEEAVERYFASLKRLKNYEDIAIVVKAEGEKPLNLSIEVVMDPTLQTAQSQELLKQAAEEAFKAAEDKAKELRLWRSSTKSKRS